LSVEDFPPDEAVSRLADRGSNADRDHIGRDDRALDFHAEVAKRVKVTDIAPYLEPAGLKIFLD
jgi:hypothetical protein